MSRSSPDQHGGWIEPSTGYVAGRGRRK